MFRIYIAGDNGIGRRTFLRSFDVPPQKYQIYYRSEPPLDVPFLTNRGRVVLRFVWPERTMYFSPRAVQIDAAILMFDLTSRITFKNLSRWQREVSRWHDKTVPMMVVGNKADLSPRRFSRKNFLWTVKKHLPYYEISAKANYQLQEVCSGLLRLLLDDTAVLRQAVLLNEPTIKLDENWQHMLENEWRNWPAILPESSDDDL